MTTSLVCFAAILSAAGPAQSWPISDQPAPQLAFQQDVPFEDEVPAVSPGMELAPPQTFAQQPFQPSGEAYPFAVQQPPPGAYDPYAAQPYQPGQSFASDTHLTPFTGFGPQQRTLGWTSNHHAGIIPKSRTSGGLGQFEISEFDLDWVYAAADSYGNIAAIAPEFGLRLWDGPSAPPGSPVWLPGQVYHFGLDLQWNTDRRSPWAVEFGFNPSINTDLENSPSRDAYNFDARGILYYTAAPGLTYAIGAAFWDRVKDRVVPNAGMILRPVDNSWELRLMFPETRLTYKLGYFWLGYQALYGRVEYNVEAYEIKMHTTGLRERVELESWRGMIGLESDHHWFTKYAEVGWIFGRDVDFANGTPGFDVSTGFIARAGINY